MIQQAFDPEKLIEARGTLTQEQAAKLLGKSKQLLNMYEKGKSVPPINEALRMCKIFGIRLERLLSPAREVQRKKFSAASKIKLD